VRATACILRAEATAIKMIGPLTPSHPLSREPMLLRLEINSWRFWFKNGFPSYIEMNPERELAAKERLAYCEKRLAELKAQSA
jgi:hypothetical protein